MPLIILDRDGVINYDSDDYIKSEDEFRPIPGSLEAIAALKRSGYQVAVVTNQSGIARGYYDLDTLQRMHDKLRTLLKQVGGEIDAIYYCPHGPDDGCACRKPRPGMLQQALREFDADPATVLMIGDSVSDLQAAASVGMPACLVRTGKGKRSLAKMREQELFSDVPVYDDLQAAVNTILSTDKTQT